MAETTVKVVVRCRPLLPHETDKDVKNVSTIDEDGGRITISGRTHDYGNESVVGGGDRHATMYDRTAKPLIAQLFDGYNATVLAYGQTGSGKTHTMGTAFDESGVDGVVPRAVAEIIDRREKLITEGRGCLIVCSMCEVYQEEVRDLLMECDEDEGPKALAVREAPNGGGVTIAGLSEREVSSIEAVVALTREGTRRRMTAATNMNEHSSRSHMILSFRVEVAGGEGRSKTSSKLHLVDLAGSERVKRTQAEGTRLQEGIEINKSLFMLGNVIQRLVELQSSEKRKGGHVPYRDSTLTRLLSDSLGGTAHTCMVACVSPGDVDINETLNTLRWADKASVVKNVAGIHVVVDPKAERLQIAERAELESLREMVRLLKSEGGASQAPDEVRVLQKALTKAEKNHRKDTQQLRKTIDTLQAKNDALSKRCDVLRLALPPAAAEAAESQLPVDDDVAIASEQGDVDEESSSDEEEDDDDETEQERKLAALLLEEKCMDSLKQHYERAIEKLETEVCALERERAELQRKASASDSEATTRILREKTRKLELAMERVKREQKRAQSEVNRCGGLKDRAEHDARRLRQEVEESRRKRGELQRRLQQRDADHARAAREWKREAKRLRRDNERVRGEKTKLVQRFARQEQTQARVLAETRGALRKARAGLVGASQKEKRHRSPIRHRGRTVQRVVEENADGMPDWLEAEVERRAARVLNGEAKASSDPLLSLTASSDECRTLLRLLADEAARARAAERDARSTVSELDAKNRAQHKSWLAEERSKFKARQSEETSRRSETLSALMAGVSSLAGLSCSASPAAAGLNCATTPAAPVPRIVEIHDDDDVPTKAVVDSDDASSLALREYARRRARHRASLSGLQEDAEDSPEDEQMGQLMRAVSALQKHGLDTADSNLLRDRVERTYAKPWQVNARIDDAVSVPPPPPPVSEEETTRLKATKNYEKPWRHMAKPPQPPAEFEVTGTGLGPPAAVVQASAPGGPPSPDVVRSTSENDVPKSPCRSSLAKALDVALMPRKALGDLSAQGL
jgi:kinesin family protein 4/21/27